MLFTTLSPSVFVYLSGECSHVLQCQLSVELGWLCTNDCVYLYLKSLLRLASLSQQMRHVVVLYMNMIRSSF